MTVQCDTDWATCPVARILESSFVVKIGESLISWKLKKQSIVSRSSAEAEYKNMANAIAEVAWLVGLFAELKIELPVKLYCNSKTTLQIAANPIDHKRTKHIEIDCHFIREKICEGLIHTEHVSSAMQLVDILTKGLGRTQLEFLLSKLGMFNLFTLHNLRESVKSVT